jgi:protein TonB
VVSGDHAAGWSPGGPQWENLRAAIQRRVVYPDVARRMGWQGKVIVIFVLQKDGQVSDVRVQAGSGFASLDGSAQQAVERAAPLPPAGESVQIVMPIVFALR